MTRLTKPVTRAAAIVEPVLCGSGTRRREYAVTLDPARGLVFRERGRRKSHVMPLAVALAHAIHDEARDAAKAKGRKG